MIAAPNNCDNCLRAKTFLVFGYEYQYDMVEPRKLEYGYNMYIYIFISFLIYEFKSIHR